VTPLGGIAAKPLTAFSVVAAIPLDSSPVHSAAAPALGQPQTAKGKGRAFAGHHLAMREFCSAGASVVHQDQRQLLSPRLGSSTAIAFEREKMKERVKLHYASVES
jgi:hypothetical protein